MRPKNIPDKLDLIDLFTNEKTCVNFLQSKNVFYETYICDVCGGNLALDITQYRCTKNRCCKRSSLLKNSFFSNSKVKCGQILRIGYLWLAGCKHGTIMNLTGFKYSDKTITAYLKYYRQLVASMLESDDGMIGGPDIIVEIDNQNLENKNIIEGTM